MMEQFFKDLEAICYYWFVCFMRWATEFELAIAEGTGRNPDNVRLIRDSFNGWKDKQQWLELTRL